VSGPHRRRLWTGLALASIGLAFSLLGPRLAFALLGAQRTYAVDRVPAHDVAVVLGARVYPGGHPSGMLADRLRTGADLYHGGKVRVLLMTGDNSTVDYNEPDAMKRYAIGLGVPGEAVVVDYAGRRTYDSCYRARHIFQLRRAIVVTQRFHLDRALVLCNALGLDAVGVAADYQRPSGYDRASITYSSFREVPAALAALMDLLRLPPPILGEPLPIELPGSATGRAATPHAATPPAGLRLAGGPGHDQGRGCTGCGVR